MVNVSNLKKAVVLLNESIEALKYHTGPHAISLHRVLTVLIASLPDEDRDEIMADILSKSTNKVALYNSKQSIFMKKFNEDKEWDRSKPTVIDTPWS